MPGYPRPVSGAGGVGMMADTPAQVQRERGHLVNIAGSREKWGRCSVAFTFSFFILWKWIYQISKRRLLVSKTFFSVSKKRGSRENLQYFDVFRMMNLAFFHILCDKKILMN